MTNEEIITSLRQLTNTKTCTDTNILKLLEEHQCFFLLQQINPQQNKLIELTSILATRERYIQAVPLFNALKTVPYAIIKGAVLSNLIYHSPTKRQSGDLDILLRRQDLIFVKQTLLNNGFVQGRVINNCIKPFSRQELIFQASQSHQVAPFVKKTENKLCPFVNFDLNTSIFWGEYEQFCDMDLVLSETENTNLFDFEFKKLTPEMEFIALCLHHYKDMNSIYLLATKGLCLKLFYDLFYYVKNVDLDLDKLRLLSTQIHATPYVYYCLWHTDQIFDAPFLKPFLKQFNCSDGISLLSTFGLCAAERRKWEIDFFDRLFSPTFKEDFFTSLNEQERKKVQTNQRHMK